MRFPTSIACWASNRTRRDAASIQALILAVAVIVLSAALGALAEIAGLAAGAFARFQTDAKGYAALVATDLVAGAVTIALTACGAGMHLLCKKADR